MEETSNSKNSIIVALIAAAGLIIATSIPFACSKSSDKLATKETTETKAPDGTITKRQLETYK